MNEKVKRLLVGSGLQNHGTSLPEYYRNLHAWAQSQPEAAPQSPLLDLEGYNHSPRCSPSEQVASILSGLVEDRTTCNIRNTQLYTKHYFRCEYVQDKELPWDMDELD